MKRQFDDIIKSLKSTICTYKWFVDFAKVYKNIEKVEIHLNILNYLIGKEDFDNEFISLIKEYPEVISTFPILIAVRKNKILVIDGEVINYSFNPQKMNNLEDYLKLFKETGLKELFVSNKINNLVDYVTGVEVGLDSNARKNRTGKAMEDLVEDFLKRVEGIEYLVQASKEQIALNFNTNVLEDLDVEDAKSNKRFDFAVKSPSGHIFLIETNFYGSGGSKLNETARSYTQLANSIKKLNGVSFIWFTDGKGWKQARTNLYNAYLNIDHLYTLYDLQTGILDELLK